jgi:hypothetical protein
MMFRSPLVIGLAASLTLGCTHRTQPEPTRQGPDLAEQVVATLLTGIARGSTYATSKYSATVEPSASADSNPSAPDHSGTEGIPLGLGAGATPAAGQQEPVGANAASASPSGGIPLPGGAVSAAPTPVSAAETGTPPSSEAEPAAQQAEASAPAQATAAPAPESTQPEQQSLEEQSLEEQPSTEAAEPPSEGHGAQPRENAVQPEFPSGSGVGAFGQEAARSNEPPRGIPVPGVGAPRPLTLREESLATPAAAGVGTTEESKGVAGFTGAGAGQGFTGVSAGSAFTGVGAGEGFTGAGAGDGFTGAGAGEGFTGAGAGEGFTGIGAGEGFTGVGAGQSFTSPGAGVNPYRPGWPTPVFGFSWIPGTMMR